MSTHGVVQTWPRTLLQLEGAAIFASTVYLYRYKSLGSWPLFLGALLLPDLAMGGYLANTRVGAVTYNLLHTETPAVALLVAGLVSDWKEGMTAGLIWLAHIGMDRMFGFGLKYGDSFGHTHLGSIGH